MPPPGSRPFGKFPPEDKIGLMVHGLLPSGSQWRCAAGAGPLLLFCRYHHENREPHTEHLTNTTRMSRWSLSEGGIKPGVRKARVTPQAAAVILARALVPGFSQKGRGDGAGGIVCTVKVSAPARLARAERCLTTRKRRRNKFSSPPSGLPARFARAERCLTTRKRRRNKFSSPPPGLPGRSGV